MAEKNQAVELVKKLIAAESCYSGLRELGNEWLAAQGTPEEKAVSARLVQALKEDVNTIDDSLRFFESEAGEQFFGKETAAQMIAAFKEAKANGAKYCLCPACAAGAELLEMQDLLL